MNNFDNIILIAGCPRSGTSMTAGVVNLCGAWGGKLSGATPNNKRGMFENGEIRDLLVKPTLNSIGADPMGQKPLPDMEKVSKLDHNVWRKKIEVVFERQGCGQQKLFYKGPKMTLMYPLWHKAFSKAKWIIVRRRDEDIIQSCLRTGFMRAYTGREGWKKWVLEHEKLFIQMKEGGLDIMEVYPQRMIDGNFEEIKSVIGWLGLTWKGKEVREFICPELWHGRGVK